MDRHERGFKLSHEQREYLMKLIRLHNDTECSYRLLYNGTAKNALKHDSYSIVGQENFQMMNAHYIKWKKRDGERIK